MEFILLFIVSVFFWLHGVYTGWKAREEHTKKLLENLLDKEEKDEAAIHITIEKHYDILYVYDKTDKTFLAQGKTRKELEEMLSTRFPGKQFAASQEDLQKAGMLS
jgi:hypothetical protein